MNMLLLGRLIKMLSSKPQSEDGGSAVEDFQYAASRFAPRIGNTSWQNLYVDTYVPGSKILPRGYQKESKSIPFVKVSDLLLDNPELFRAFLAEDELQASRRVQKEHRDRYAEKLRGMTY